MSQTPANTINANTITNAPLANRVRVMPLLDIAPRRLEFDFEEVALEDQNDEYEIPIPRLVRQQQGEPANVNMQYMDEYIRSLEDKEEDYIVYDSYTDTKMLDDDNSDVEDCGYVSD